MKTNLDNPQHTPQTKTAAAAYFVAGWHPLELPAGAKAPPPDGRTGYEGSDMTREQIEASDWSGNVGLRVPPDVIGLDVDAYKGGLDTLNALINQLGPLPSTRISHSGRNDGSGIRFYRVPILTWVTSLPGIEIIQRVHRYAAVWPSMHPDGRQYGWWDQAEAGPLEASEVPLVEDLPEMPWSWIGELSRATQADTSSRSTAADRIGTMAFITTHDSAEASSYLSTILGHFVDRHQQGYSRHDTMQHCLIWAMEMARAMVIAAQPAIDQLGQEWVAALQGDPRRQALHDDRRVTEFEAMLRHAVGKATAKPQAVIDKLHDDYAGIKMNPSSPPVDSQLSVDDALSWLTPLSTQNTGLRITADLGLMTDGRGLLHLARFNLLHGDSGAGKSFMEAFMVAECIKTQRRVAVFDLEDGPEVLGQRLMQLGIPWPQQEEWLLFFHPDEATTPALMRAVVELLIERDVCHAFIDSMGEAFGVDGVDENSDFEVTAWITRVVRPLCNAGIGVTSLDHVTKAGDNLLYPSGSKRKRAAVTGTNFLMYATEPYSLEGGGRATLRCAKDRHGQYRRGDDVAELTMQPLDPIFGQTAMELAPVVSIPPPSRPDLLIIAVNTCQKFPGQTLTKTQVIADVRTTAGTTLKFADKAMGEALEAAALRGFLTPGKGYNGHDGYAFARPIPPNSPGLMTPPAQMPSSDHPAESSSVIQREDEV